MATIVKYRIWAQIEVEYVPEDGESNGEFVDLVNEPARLGEYETLDEANAALQSFDEWGGDGVAIDMEDIEAEIAEQQRGIRQGDMAI